jgi:micrococcal nuclease
VIDGDTIGVRAEGARRSRYTVRLIGIDTPETKAPGRPVECGGPQATSNLLGLTFSHPQDTNGDGLVDARGEDSELVELVTDPTQDLFDRFGRLLAYVDLLGGVQLNVRQAADGWADVYVRRRPFPQVRRFSAAAERAFEGQRGVHALCGGEFHRPAA